MREAIRAKAQRAWQTYLLPGYVIGGIKFLSVFTWFFYQPVAGLFGLSSQHPSFVQMVGILAVGLIAAALAMIAWPVAILMMIVGYSNISEMLFYPWVTAS